MSWFSRSLRLDDEDETSGDSQSAVHDHESQQHTEDEEEELHINKNEGRGVKEDLSEFKDTLTRQLWGVASFLVPTPPPPPTNFNSDRIRSESPDQSDSCAVSEEFDNFGGKFGDGELNCSNFESEAVGITEEVLAFAMNIAHHPETWLDFPLYEDEDLDDFDMSDAQHKHAMAVESLARRLAALRRELCPAHMSEGYFWKVYFVLLHSRLNKHDAELLSTPQIVAARATWMQELQKRTKPESDLFGRSTFYSNESANSPRENFHDDVPYGNTSRGKISLEATTYHARTIFETDKHPVESTDIQIIDKSVIEEEPVMKVRDKEIVTGPSYPIPVQDYEDDGDDWLDDNSELEGYSGTAIMNEEDVSFSDLEDDDDCTPMKSRIASRGLDTPTKT